MCSIYWFAFQTLAGSFALNAILMECFAVDIPLPVIGLVFASLQVLVAAIGIKWLRSLFAWALPLKLVSLFFILFMMIRVPGNPDVALQIPVNENWLLAIIWFNASFGGMLTIIHGCRRLYPLHQFSESSLAGGTDGKPAWGCSWGRDGRLCHVTGGW